MKKLTIADAADHFGVSKEAIHNRVRRGSLNCIVEDGVKFVVISAPKGAQNTNSVPDARYTQYIEQENERLRGRVDVLENETSRLRDQREQMLIDERIKVEQIYKERDAQLRNVLHVVATKFLITGTLPAVPYLTVNYILNCSAKTNQIEKNCISSGS